MKKKILSLALALTMCLGLTIPAFAAEPWTDSHEGINIEAFLDGTIFYFNITKSEEYTGSGELDLSYVIGALDDACRHIIFQWLDDLWDIYGKDYAMKMSSNIVCQVNIEQGLFATDELKQQAREEIDIMGDGSWTIMFNDSTTPTQPDKPAGKVAYASTQAVLVDGKKVEFQMYALKDANGNGTNYIKLRDMAYVLNGTKAQFAVGYDGTISLTTGQAYAAAGGEMTTPFSGDRTYSDGTQSVKVNGKPVEMTAITLLDDAGGGYNYFKLRDLGKALGFNVGWSKEAGVFIESDKPYAG